MYYENSIGKVYYEVHGPEYAPALLFSHGICLNHETFLPQVEVLKNSYRVILWDLPYHGLSQGMDDNLPFTTTAADFIIELMDSLHVHDAVLVGQSLGSFVAQKAAYNHPNRIKATVHLGGTPLYPGINPVYQLMAPLLSLFIYLYPHKLLFRAFANHRALRPETKSYMETVASNTGKKVMAHITGQLLRDMARGLPRPSAEPKLLCYGDHENPLVQRMVRGWHKRAPESRLEIIEEAHHIANQDNPQAFNDRLIDFLDNSL